MLNYAYIGIADLFSGKLATACPKFVHNELNIYSAMVVILTQSVAD